MVRGSVACFALLIAGCASAYRPPYGAPSWGFIERSRVNPSYEGIVIATSDYLTKNPKDAGKFLTLNVLGQDGKTKRTVIWQCLNGAIPRVDAQGTP